MDRITEAKLLAVREGVYTLYVFKDNINNTFIMCTRLPNWQIPDVTIGDEGFLQYQTVKAGEEYFDVTTGEKNTFKYTNVYFVNFVKKSEDINKETIIL